MKYIVNTARILVGSLFIFSGLVKAIDPLGLAYKMQEFFEVWSQNNLIKGLMMWFDGQALWLSILIISLEVILGVALLIGWRIKLTSSLIFLLMLFFTFLTSYVFYSGKIRTCGCFGDCIPLTPSQTFTKDLILLALIIVISYRTNFIKPVFSKGINFSIVFISLIAVTGLQWYVLRHLPVKDCLPFKKGNNLLKLRQMPENAIPDKYDYTFIYQKKGEQKEFNASNLPDSSWQYVDRKQTLIQQGSNNVPLINDFNFTTSSGNDTTKEILSQSGEYYLFFIKDFQNYPNSLEKDLQLVQKASAENKPIYFITGRPYKVKERFAGKTLNGGKIFDPIIFTCDATAIKTAARANPVVYLMKGSVVQGKWGWADFDEIR